MIVRTRIDISFDFQSDTPQGEDPDALSPALHNYHQFLWSKPLPSGAMFELHDARPRRYLITVLRLVTYGTRRAISGWVLPHRSSATVPRKPADGDRS